MSEPKLPARIFCTAVACSLALAAMFALAPSAASAESSAGACVGDRGVTVVVDATKVGGGISVRCALGPQPNGWEALQNAGHAVTSVNGSGGAVCTIDGVPAEGFPTCWESNYWSYWHAPNASPGAAWTYSGVGAGVYEPAPGAVEGWKYISTGGGREQPGAGPAFAESQPPTTVTTLAPPPPSPGDGGAVGDGPPSAGAGGGGPAGVGAGSGPAPTRPGAATTVVPVAPTTTPPAAASQGAPSTTGTAPGTSVAGAASRALGDTDLARDTDPGARGFPVATALGLVAILAFAVAGAIVAHRRRTSAGAASASSSGPG